jgi:Raf kinase inhibitor-like YbhB/YbcL family protein
MMRQSLAFRYILILLATVFVVFTGCRSPAATQTEEGEVPMSIQFTSPAFSEGSVIPKRHTCDGADKSPQLDWSSIPQGTKSLALIADDPDAPVGTWVHWVLYDLHPDLTGLSEGASGKGMEGKNDFKKLGYGGPCPPKGSEHRYYFKLYALDAVLNLKEGATKADVEKAMRGHILAQGQLMGKYSR